MQKSTLTSAADEKSFPDLNNLLTEIKLVLSKAQLTAPENDKSSYQILIDQIAQLEGQPLNVEQRDHVQSTLSNLKIINGVLQTENITSIATQINNNILEQKPSPPVDVIAYQEKLRKRYSAEVFSMIKPLFGKPLEMEGQYINLQLIYHVKDKDKEKKADEASSSKEFKDERISSFEDLFGKKRAVKLDNLFQPADQLFSTEEMPEYEKKGECPWLLLVQGRAGIGKTTMAYYLAWAWGQKKLWQNRESQYEWVFYLPLRNLKALTLKEWVFQTYFDDGVHSKEDFNEIWLKIIAEKGKTLFILDGYDERPDNYGDQNENALNDLLNSGNEHHVLITSRPYGIDDLPVKRRNLEVIGFTDENIIHYVENYFEAKKRKEQASDLLNILRNHISLWSNAHVPVILNIMCGVHEDSEEKNDKDNTQASVLSGMTTMTKLYQKMEAALADRSYLTQLKLEGDKINFKKQNKKAQQREVKEYYHHAFDFLAYLAYEGLIAEQGGLILPNEKVEAARDEYGEKLALLPEEEADCFEKAKILGFLKPILNEEKVAGRENSCGYEFLHLTFQEYFAACYVAKGLMMDEAADPFKHAKTFILQEKYNQRYQIVFWFVAGLLGEKAKEDKGAGLKCYLDLVRYQGARDLIGHAELGLLIRVLDESENEYTTLCLKEIRHQIQDAIYQLYKEFVSGYWSYKMDGFSVIEMLKISPNVCKNVGNKDDDIAWALKEEIEKKNIKEVFSFIGQTTLVTPIILKLSLEVFKNSHRDCAIVAEALSKLGEKAATEEVITALLAVLRNTTLDGNSRARAAEALGRLGEKAATEEIITALLAVLRNTALGGESRAYAAEALGRLGEKAVTEEVITALVAVLQDMTLRRSTHLHAVEALVRLGEKAATEEVITVLLAVLQNTTLGEESRAYVAQALGLLGEKAATEGVITALVTVLRDMTLHRSTHLYAVEALGRLGKKAATEEVITAVAAILEDKALAGNSRAYVAQALDQLGGEAVTGKVITALVAVLRDMTLDEDSRAKAAQALGQLGEKAAMEAVIAALVVILQNTTLGGNIRTRAAQALGQLGKKAATEEVIIALLAALQDTTLDGHGRIKMAQALDQLGREAATEAVIDALVAVLQNMTLDGYSRAKAAEALGQLGEKAATEEKVIKALVAALQDKTLDRYSRAKAAEALGRLGEKAATEEVITVLLAALQDTTLDGYGRIEAAQALDQLGGEAATEAVIIALVVALQDATLGEYRRAGVAKTLSELSKLKLEKLSQALISSQDFAFLILMAYLTKTFSLQIQEDISSKQFFLQAYWGKQPYKSSPFESSKAEELRELARKVIKNFQKDGTIPNDTQTYKGRCNNYWNKLKLYTFNNRNLLFSASGAILVAGITTYLSEKSETGFDKKV